MDTTPRIDAAPERAVRRRSRQEGQGMVEYSLIIVLIAIVALVALQVLGHSAGNLYSNISNSFGP
ncbi:MAG TPA: Flp family type IVb pilin [Candidatus Dormibacteraeota bacterium]|jgi:pilus assembly protein Flp/PilA|nr:Flp family type IVb pilin [Candidatus Dormibacteraeota bacterium]